MPQFTPEPRQTVVDHLGDESTVDSAGPVAHGLRVKLTATSNCINLGGVLNAVGWYVDSVDWERRCLYIFPMGEADD